MKSIILMFVFTITLFASVDNSECIIMKKNVIDISTLLTNSENSTDNEFINITNALKREIIDTKSKCILTNSESKYYNELLELL